MYGENNQANLAPDVPGGVESAVRKHLATFQELSLRLGSTIEALARAKDQYRRAAEHVVQLDKERQIIVQEIGGCAGEIERALNGTTSSPPQGALNPAIQPSMSQAGGCVPSPYGGLGQHAR